MFRTVHRCIQFATLALALAACKGGGQLKIARTNFESEIAQAQNLVFTFNRDVAPIARVGVWDTVPYLAIEPATPGRFQWTAANELVFSPSQPFAPSTDFTARLTPKVLTVASAEGPRSVSEAPITFHTPYLDITSATSYWDKSPSGKAEAHVVLNFNYAVKPAELKNLLTVKLNDAETPYTLASVENTAAVELQVAPDKLKASEDLSLRFEVKPGLTCVASGWQTKDPLRYVAEFPAADLLAISNVETASSGERSTVNVYTTQALPASGLAQYISVSPEVSYSVQATDNGFRLEGAFDQQEVYTLKVSKNLKGVLGATLGTDYEQTFQFQQVGEVIAFMQPNGQYLPGAGGRGIGVRINGVAKVQVRILKVYENNLLHFFRGGARDYDYSYDEGEEYHSWESYRIDDYGDPIAEKEYAVKDLPSTPGGYLIDMNFLDSRKAYSGIYIVEVSASDKLWVRDSKVVSVSDIGLIARQSGNDIWVFANSIKTTQPLANTTLTLVSSNNQQVYTQTTNGEGLAVFKDLGANAPNFRVAMVSARSGDDFNYLSLGRNEVNTSRFDVGGKYTRARPYDAYLYGDRDLYRPGDSLHLNAIVRAYDWQLVGSMPVRLTVTLPTGREMTTRQGTLDAQGAFQASVALPAATPTGTYTLELFTGDGQLIGSRSVQVEEFIPDRIKVDLKLSGATLSPGQKLEVSATATNLFGPPATGRNYEVELSLRRKAFRPAGLDDFDFSLDDERTFENELRSGQTDAAGLAQETFGPFPDYTNYGLLEGRVFTSVFDETGRPVNRVQSFELFTQPTFFGVGRFDYYAATGQPLSIPLVAVDILGKVLSNVQARVEVVKVDYETVIQKTYSSYRYVSQRRERTLVNRLVPVTGRETKFTFTPTLSGQYLVRVSKPGTRGYVTSSFYAWGWGTTQSTSFEVSTEGTVLIEANKTSYTTGEKAELLFKTPFEGKLLVTYERDRVISHTVLKTENRAAKLDLRLEGDHVPNVFVSATLIRPVDGPSPLPLTVAHGYANLRVESPSTKLPLTLEAAEKSTSRRKQTIRVKTAAGAQVTLAVVDEGILQIRNTASPNPYDYFYAPRALEVTPYDLYAELLPDLGGKFARSSTGGDGADLERRVNPLTNKRVKLVSYWSGVAKADGSGEASFTVDIPQFSGQLRLMAVAYKDGAFAGADKPMTVADPVVVSTALPRFLTPGDRIEVPITLTNTTARGTSASVSVAVTGPIQVVGSTTQKADLPANREVRLQVALAAQGAVGEARVVVKVQALGGTYTEEIDLPVRPASPLVKVSDAGSVAGGQSATLSALGQDFAPQSRRGKLVLSRSPLVQFSKNLDYLLGYPYGCIEQTVSKAFPQLYYADLVKAIGQKQYGSADYTLREAIAKVQGMQLYNGSFSYWPGGDYTSNWGSVFATHFLYEAKKAGYEVDSKVLKNATRYLRTLSGDRETERYYISGNEYRNFAKREVLYALFVLALTGEQPMSTLNFYKNSLQLLTTDSRYLLACTYALLGDQASFRAVLPSGFGGEVLPRQTGGSFSSPLRDRALALYTLLEVEPRHTQVGSLVKEVSANLKRERWLSTQEAVFSYMALGRFARQAAKSTVTAEVKVGGKTVGKMDGNDLVLTDNVAGQRLELATRGSGELFYFYEASGLSTTGAVTEEDSRIRIRRAYYTRSGTQLSEPTFQQNDLVVVRLTVSALENESLDNIVVADLLPAGLEVENSRLGALPDLNWIRDASTPQYLDIRDDRVLFFTSLYGTQERNYYYVCRAVSPGTFVQGPASADAMYDGTIHSYHGAGTVTVRSASGPGQ